MAEDFLEDQGQFPKQDDRRDTCSQPLYSMRLIDVVPKSPGSRLAGSSTFSENVSGIRERHMVMVSRPQSGVTVMRGIEAEVKRSLNVILLWRKECSFDVQSKFGISQAKFQVSYQKDVFNTIKHAALNLSHYPPRSLITAYHGPHRTRRSASPNR